ncbi:hypothetical protein V9N58_003335 [Vibrio cholerae]|uniref:hypothetical protein n=1 Tax=Vibrio cholerae TaxID=666 RepID=UPI0000EF8C77|nr:hypothetical protein [Vibrio cholerae]EGQ8202451.1 hypothetical protein [Vibrio cholerae]EGR1098875.1 hypothetical protein [Vibrio cholerae]EGR4218163.1 hypothetical protein [Vibrio cholerae]EGR4347904.1 hypothetical protein [Vibrio cholerae]EGR4370267.1 hypothetical protein [Vibrio cholerae]
MADGMLMIENNSKIDRLRREVKLAIERAALLISKGEDIAIINHHLNELEKAHLSFEEEYNFSLEMKGN